MFKRFENDLQTNVSGTDLKVSGIIQRNITCIEIFRCMVAECYLHVVFRCTVPNKMWFCIMSLESLLLAMMERSIVCFNFYAVFFFGINDFIFGHFWSFLVIYSIID